MHLTDKESEVQEFVLYNVALYILDVFAVFRHLKSWSSLARKDSK